MDELSTFTLLAQAEAIESQFKISVGPSVKLFSLSAFTRHRAWDKICLFEIYRLIQNESKFNSSRKLSWNNMVHILCRTYIRDVTLTIWVCLVMPGKVCLALHRQPSNSHRGGTVCVRAKQTGVTFPVSSLLDPFQGDKVNSSGWILVFVSLRQLVFPLQSPAIHIFSDRWRWQAGCW